MPRKGTPDRWLNYSSYGKPIAGTNFIAFKVPLNENISHRLPAADQWTPAMLLKEIPDLGMVIDLTNTTRYYNPEILKTKNVHYVKILCEGHGKLPSPRMLSRFHDAVDSFRNSRENSGHLLGVHCTHGLNRTGYFICSYMIDKMGFAPEAAISAFNEARGHPMERLEYVNDLTSGSNFHPQTLPPYPSADAYPISNPLDRERYFGNHTSTDYLRPDEPRGNRTSPSFHEAASHGHDMASNQTRRQHFPYGSQSGLSEASGSRHNVQHQTILYSNDSLPGTKVHEYNHGAETRKLASYETGTQLDRPVYPNQHKESPDSNSYGTHFPRPLYPNLDHFTQSHDNSYSVCTQLERPLYHNQHLNNGAEIRHSNVYSDRTRLEKPMHLNHSPESGAETRDFTSHNISPHYDPSSSTAYGESWQGCNDYSGTARNDCGENATNASDFNTWMAYREPTQVKRGNTRLYRKPYRARRRH